MSKLQAITVMSLLMAVAVGCSSSDQGAESVLNCGHAPMSGALELVGVSWLPGHVES